MKATTIILAMLLLTGVAASQSPGAAAAEEFSEKESAEIGGTVVSAKTGEPLKSVVVAINDQSRNNRRRLGRETTTDLDGRFHFSDLPPGDYSISTMKTGYESRRNRRTAMRVSLAEGVSRNDLVIRLRPSVVITGRVLDPWGDPLPGVDVTAYSRRHEAGEILWTYNTSGMSNDLGEYRIYGLTAGKYVVGAAASSEVSAPGVFYSEYVPSFYANAFSQKEATVLQLDWGTEMKGIDFQLARAPSTVLSGVVIDGSTGGPCLDCSVRAWRNQTEWLVRGIQPNRQGAFAIHGLLPGEAVITAQTRDDDPLFAREDVQISERGQEGLQLVALPGQTVTGEVVLVDPPVEAEEGGGRRPGLYIQLVGKLGWGWRGRGRALAPAQGGPFSIERVAPGTYRLEVRTPPGGGYFRSLLRSGQRLAEPEITVTAGGPISDLEVRISYDGGSIQGMVQPPGSSAESLLPEGRVAVVPDELGGYRDLRWIRYRPDGSFTVSLVAPGHYKLYAVANESPLELWDPAIRRALEPFHREVRLEPEQAVTVELPLISDERLQGRLR